jgi:hypothetical protein
VHRDVTFARVPGNWACTRSPFIACVNVNCACTRTNDYVCVPGYCAFTGTHTLGVSLENVRAQGRPFYCVLESCG